MASEVDVVIVGAGAAGLSAAKSAAAHGQSFVLLEASHRIGGRARTEDFVPGQPFDLGCHWMHSASFNPFVGIAPPGAGASARDSRPPGRRSPVLRRRSHDAEYICHLSRRIADRPARGGGDRRPVERGGRERVTHRGSHRRGAAPWGTLPQASGEYRLREIALAMLGLVALGAWMVGLTYYDPWYNRSLALHKAFRVLLLVLAAARFGWRAADRPPGFGPEVKAWERAGARAMHWLPGVARCGCTVPTLLPGSGGPLLLHTGLGLRVRRPGSAGVPPA